jgi:serine/threonine protein kinase/tetratricopeptide (TPR) repeat protein
MECENGGASTKWEAIIRLFEQAIDSEDPERALAEEKDPEVSGEARRLVEDHRRAEETEFLAQPFQLAIAATRGRFSAGDRLAARFTVVKALGFGGMGEVYLAYDQLLERNVAIKSIRGHLAGDEGIRHRFLQEVRNAHQVTHPNVCRIFDVFEEGNHAFFAMELLDGDSLAARLKSGIRPSEAKWIALGLAEGLHAAHKKKIVHCDFKPTNVILTNELPHPRPVITDFGLARALGDGGAASTQSLQAGTTDYMAPELKSGEPAAVLTDIYSFGKVLGELCPGHHLAAECSSADPKDRPESLKPVISDLSGATSRRRWLVAAGVAAGAVGVWAGYEYTHPPITLLARQRIAFNGFRPADGPRASLLRDLVITAIRQSLNVTVAPDDSLRSMLNRANRPTSLPANRADILAAAGREGIALLIEGVVTDAANGLKLAIQVFEPGRTAPAVAFEEQVRSPREVVPLADRVAQKLRREFGESEQAIRATHVPLGQVTSQSPEAVEFYFRGVRLYDNAEAEAAITWFEQAISVDPQFAMAHAFRALALTARFKLFSALPSFEKAFALRARLAERERGWIEFQYYNFVRDNARSLDSARRLASLYPEDATYQRNVAFAYAFTGRPSDALPYSRRAIELDPNNNNLSELIVNSAEANEFDQAIEAWRTFLDKGDTNTLLDWGAGLAWMGKGDMTQATEAFQRMGSDARRERWARLLSCAPLILSGRFSEAATTLESDLAWDRATGEENFSITRRVWLGWLRLLMDQPAKARAAAAETIALDAQPATLDGLRDASLIVAAAGDANLANQGLEKLRVIEQRWPSTRTQGVRLHVQGALAGNTEEAGTLLYQAVGLWRDSPAVFSQIQWAARNHSPSEALALGDTLEQQRGRILKRCFPGLLVLGWMERAKCLARMSRIGDSLRLYRQVQSYWLNSAPKYGALQRFKEEMAPVEREARGDRFLGNVRASDNGR